ncbi:sugar phosphate isomerase/epimerase family protein [Lentzea sp.]|uniref:sugar phosphate isomerase/epimerase family protein n=1 Tax=Lentzea sp. TaxID=56099 RepID=UPI002C932986|nr:sugar phosphate isomerase/epimerase family protein [Lentzea sp.]HUQ56457.1 sugar phosphate isomerase/epimerase family protein [Lentzea sp.]
MTTAWRDRVGGIGDEAAIGLADQIAVHRELGWPLLELRGVGGVALGDLEPADRREVARLVAAAGLSVPCLDSRIGNWARPVTGPFALDVAELDALSDLADLLGTRYVRVMSYPGDGVPEPEWRDEVISRLGRLAALARARGLVLLHENCSGWAGTSAARTLTLLEAVGSPALRVLFDVGNPVAHGYDGVEYLQAVLPYVDHVHVKDAVRGPDSTTFTTPGAGAAELRVCLETLLDKGYEGAFCVEPHVAVLPHLGRRADPAEVRERYLEFGRLFERLLAEVVA